MLTPVVGCVKVTVLTTVQPLPSVTVTLYVPAAKLEKVPELWLPVPRLNIYGAVPPVAAIVKLPLPLFKQVKLFWLLIVVPKADAGCVMLTVRTVVQLLASVTVTFYVPAATPVNAPVLCAPVPRLKV